MATEKKATQYDIYMRTKANGSDIGENKEEIVFDLAKVPFLPRTLLRSTSVSKIKMSDDH